MRFLSVLLLLATHAFAADVEATTTSGEKVLLREDGTWIAKPVETVTESDPNDCSTVVSTTHDRVSGKSTTMMDSPLVLSEDGKSGLIMSALKGRQSIIWSITAIGASSCVDDDNKVNILFTDGTRMEIENDVDFNCDGRHTTYYGGVFGKRAQLDALATKDIEVVRVWTRRGYVEKTLKPEQAAHLRTAFACLR